MMREYILSLMWKISQREILYFNLELRNLDITCLI